MDALRAIPHDAAGFESLFRLHYRPLMRHARRLTSDPATASDVLQDVFLKLWECRNDLKVESSTKALLYTMVRNRALNLKRRERFAVDLPLEIADPVRFVFPEDSA